MKQEKTPDELEEEAFQKELMVDDVIASPAKAIKAKKSTQVVINYDSRDPYIRKPAKNKRARFDLQEAIKDDLDEYRRKFDDGDKSSIMKAVKLCFKYERLPPQWAREAFLSAIEKIDNFDVNSWDKVFGTPYPKGKHLNSIKKKQRLIHGVWLSVRMAYKNGASIDEGLFECIGSKFGIGKTLASEYYYEYENAFIKWTSK